jgi:uncharacterized protein
MTTIHRAYSVFDVKSIDEENRVIRGMATTPTPDRVNDVLEPMGAKFAASIPFFKHHDARLVVGRTALSKPTKNGIPFESTIPKVAEVGSLRERLEEAWQEIKYRLITGVSVGFRPVFEKIEQLKNGGLKFHEFEIVELSMVPIPMNAEAVITQFRSAGADDSARDALIQQIKSIDQAVRRAASGARPIVRLDRKPPADSGALVLPGASGATRRKGVLYLNP